MENYLGATFVIEKEHPYSDCPPLLPQRKLEVLIPQEVKHKDLMTKMLSGTLIILMAIRVSFYGRAL